jgi:hypothetical protein
MDADTAVNLVMQATQGTMLGTGVVILDVNERQPSRTKPLCLVGFHEKSTLIAKNLG